MAVGRIRSVQSRGRDSRLEIEAPELDLGDVAVGDSIAVSGVCLTAVDLWPDGFAADVSVESLQRTLIGTWSTGAEVNLEKALTPTTRMGGHLVTGHVDGVGTVKEIAQDGRSDRIVMESPAELAKFIAEKGSICVDGISLTVNETIGAQFAVNLVPHTLEMTTARNYRAGTRVHLEVDIIARYLERLLLGQRAADPEHPGLSLDTLRRAGFDL